jgi:hypothetical protein
MFNLIKRSNYILNKNCVFSFAEQSSGSSSSSTSQQGSATGGGDQRNDVKSNP